MTTETIKEQEFKKLGVYDLVQTYPEDDWAAVFTLTFAKPTTEETALYHWRGCAHHIGYPNRAFGKRLHWVCRVGGTPGHIHLHGCIGRAQLLIGNKFTYTPEGLCKAIASYWKKFGKADVQPFVPGLGGVEYVCRYEPGNCGVVEVSEGAMSVIKRIRRKKEQQEAGL